MTIYNEALTVGHLPHQHAALHSRRDKVAVVEGEERFTWAEVSERTARLANALSALGIGRGDKVSVFLPNRAQYVEIVYAIAGLGAAVVPISYRFVPSEVEYAVRFSDSKAVILDATLLDTFVAAHESLDHIASDRVVVLGGADPSTGYRDYDELLASAEASLDYLVLDEWDIYHLAFTGGTTGYPKACEVPQRMARQNWYDITVEVGVREDDTTLIAGPFYHGLGFMWGLQQLMVGGTVVMQRNFDARGALALIEQERVTFTPMAPTMYTMLLEVEEKDTFDVSSMRGLVSAAAPLLTSTKERLLDYFSGAGLFEYYGATEAGFYSVLKPADQLRKVRSVGQAWFGCELRILDAEGNDVPVGEVGQIYKRGPGLGVRYYKNPEATAEAFRGEWLTSGDLGRLDEEGYLYVVDRAKDMIISGGVNIFPTEIEEVVAAHPDVVEVAVIGLPDETWGETVHAYVVMRAGAELDEGVLNALCAERLAKYKRPRHYHAVAELPKNASGKLLKRVLRDQVAASGH
ncbi:AMP-binding protein [Nocardioides sp. AE5]|uniref:class I adenylate-forming enzyme family protein n=1 Tax=Nocardioides sp. AE5 TaxID=2962573 RepID=UPI0028817607|nr:AMP-binding protein [Nocardioides sp. AE5]MDT0202723.1 AMP-binding protein [Nocardioides sp. AE5]